jgi:hypothetical protein
MALTLNPKRCAVLAMDYQNEILGMTPHYREKNLLGTVKRVLDAARRWACGRTTSWKPRPAPAPIRAIGLSSSPMAAPAIPESHRPCQVHRHFQNYLGSCQFWFGRCQIHRDLTKTRSSPAIGSRCCRASR